MPDLLTWPSAGGVPPLVVLARLVGALLLGALVALVYRRTRPAEDVAVSFTTTLVLLAVLIAMVTQIIGDNVARAFSLVGALSIVRFRTVVRDTQDTAYVIFAVAVGMAAGASDLWVAVFGMAIVAMAAAMMRRGRDAPGPSPGPGSFLLHVRLGLGHDVRSLAGTLDAHTGPRQLVSMGTARQGVAIDVAYRTTLRAERSADDLITALNRIEGVQSASLQRVDSSEAAL